jgi:hypothetical protein
MRRGIYLTLSMRNAMLFAMPLQIAVELAWKCACGWLNQGLILFPIAGDAVRQALSLRVG